MSDMQQRIDELEVILRKLTLAADGVFEFAYPHRIARLMLTTSEALEALDLPPSNWGSSLAVTAWGARTPLVQTHSETVITPQANNGGILASDEPT